MQVLMEFLSYSQLCPEHRVCAQVENCTPFSVTESEPRSPKILPQITSGCVSTKHKWDLWFDLGLIFKIPKHRKTYIRSGKAQGLKHFWLQACATQ